MAGKGAYERAAKELQVTSCSILSEKAVAGLVRRAASSAHGHSIRAAGETIHTVLFGCFWHGWLCLTAAVVIERAHLRARGLRLCEELRLTRENLRSRNCLRTPEVAAISGVQDIPLRRRSVLWANKHRVVRVTMAIAIKIPKPFNALGMLASPNCARAWELSIRFAMTGNKNG